MEVKGRLVLDTIIKMATEVNSFIASWAAVGMTQVYLGSTTESCQKFFMPNRTMVVAYICLIITQLASNDICDDTIPKSNILSDVDKYIPTCLHNLG